MSKSSSQVKVTGCKSRSKYSLTGIVMGCLLELIKLQKRQLRDKTGEYNDDGCA